MSPRHLPPARTSFNPYPGDGYWLLPRKYVRPALLQLHRARHQGELLFSPAIGTFWACNTGLTPCILASVFNQTHKYCVLVQIWPHITYHSDKTVLQYYEQLPRREKRKAITLTLAMLLGVGGIAAGIGTGTTALIRTDHYMFLHQAMNEDLRALEKSVRVLTESLTSLSEVVLQNRRGLDLLFLKEGGLYAALREKCCFYADKTDIVTEPLDKFKKKAKKHKRKNLKPNRLGMKGFGTGPHGSQP